MTRQTTDTGGAHKSCYRMACARLLGLNTQKRNRRSALITLRIDARHSCAGISAFRTPLSGGQIVADVLGSPRRRTLDRLNEQPTESPQP